VRNTSSSCLRVRKTVDRLNLHARSARCGGAEPAAGKDVPYAKAQESRIVSLAGGPSAHPPAGDDEGEDRCSVSTRVRSGMTW